MSAVCITGLERSYAEISVNVKKTIDVLPNPILFGVNPHNLWKDVDLVFDVLENQTTCTIPRIPYFFPSRMWKGVEFELCDLYHCEQMISNYELAQTIEFRTVMRLRLDLFWETIPLLPSVIHPNDVFVPKMSHCNGICDKFAIGGRNGMRTYFIRKVWLRTLLPQKSFNSEMLLKMIGLRSKIQFHKETVWMFCKFGSNIRKFHSWSECTKRIRARIKCEKLFCDWCGRGCRCVTSGCTAPSQRQRLCFLPNASTGQSDYTHRPNFVSPGEAQAFLQ